MANMDSIARHARLLRGVALTGAAVLPLLALIGLAAPNRIVQVDSSGTLPLFWAGLVGVGQALLLAAALVALARMLGEIAGGRIFAPSATRPFHAFARLVLFSVIAGLVLPPAIEGVLIVTAGWRHLTIGIDSTEFVLLLVSFVLFLVARLFDEAARLEEEMRSIV